MSQMRGADAFAQVDGGAVGDLEHGGEAVGFVDRSHGVAVGGGEDEGLRLEQVHHRQRGGFGAFDGEHGVGDPATGGDDELSV